MNGQPGHKTRAFPAPQLVLRTEKDVKKLLLLLSSD